MLNGMPKIAKELTALAVKQLAKPGWHAVGGVAGLLLQIRSPTREGAPLARSWILRLLVANKRQPIGLGSYPQVSLADAREQARKLSLEAKSGVNLLARRRTQRSELIAAAAKNKTFQDCANAYMDTQASNYTNDKHRKQWQSTLESYAYPIIGQMIVADISMRNVLDVVLQHTKHRNGSQGKLWEVKNETCKRTLDRMRTIFNYAIVNEYRSGTNPAQWKGYLDTQLAAPRGLKTVVHHPALPYANIGGFMMHLRGNASISAKTLEFLILTGVRSGSVRQAKWDEVDLDRALWVIPAEHTKAKREHRVPLQPQAVTLLSALPKLASSELLFPSPRGGELSDMALSQLMRGMRERGELKNEAVPHGFRSTFRDWAAELTDYPDEIRKVASMHTVGDAVKEAYQRTDLLEKRRHLMADWADYIDNEEQRQTQGPKRTGDG
jgi:integrase